MAARHIARGDPVDLEGHDVGRFSLRAEGRDDRMERTHPAQASGASEAAPQRMDFGQGKLFTIAGRISASRSMVCGAGALDDRDVELRALLVFLDRRLIQRGEAGAFQKARRSPLRARRRAGPSAPRAHRAGAPAARRLQRQPARRGVGGCAFIGQAALDQRVGDELAADLPPPAAACGRVFLRRRVRGEGRA